MEGTVLIGFAEAVPAPEAVFSLSRAGYRVRAFHRAGTRAPLRGMPVGEPLAICAPEQDAEQSIHDLRQLATSLGPGCSLFALDDVSLWLANAAFKGIDPLPMTVVNAMGPQAAFALDKVAQLEAARAAGIDVPPTTVAQKIEDIRSIDAFPSIARPALAAVVENGRLVKKSARYLMTPSDAASLPEKELTFPTLVQPLIAGVGIGVFGFATPAGVVQWSGHQRLRMMNPHGSGASACMARPPSDELQRKVGDLMQGVGWRGPFMAEFLEDADGTCWFMEVNGRLWGSLALARRAGFEYPSWAVAQRSSPQFMPERETVANPPAVVRHLGRDILHLLHVMRGPKTEFHRVGWPRFWPTLAAVARISPRASFYNFDARWPRYFLRDAVDVVARALKDRQ